MIAFDTNLVVRLMVEDDERQLRKARGILEQAVERDEQVLVTDIVLSEIEWVLSSAYRVPRERILSALQALAGDSRFRFESDERLSDALSAYQHSTADLSDLLLGFRARELGATTTFTFDRVLRRLDGFTVLG